MISGFRAGLGVTQGSVLGGPGRCGGQYLGVRSPSMSIEVPLTVYMPRKA